MGDQPLAPETLSSPDPSGWAALRVANRRMVEKLDDDRLTRPERPGYFPGPNPYQPMLRTSTLASALVLAAALPAQIQIGENEMPHADDVLTRTRATADPTIDFATTGADHEWDFTDLSTASEDLTAYQSVASTNFVYAIAYADVFFNPNRANHAKAGVDIPFNQLLPITNPYTFLYHSATLYKKVGFGAEVSGIPVPIIFGEHDVIYELPLHYGDASASHSAYSLDVPTLAYYGYSQDRANEVDGWGTIATPAGSFEVLRVKTTLAGHDTINLDTLSLGFTIDRPIVREYKWLAQDLRVPVLQINTTEFFGTEFATEIFFYDLPHTITVVPPLATTLCPGSGFDLSYEATGSYSVGGLFIQANDFTAQLSDASGDFTNATDIGVVTAASSGAVTVTIPPNTPPGTGYRIRMNSSNPAYTGADNGFDITIDATAPSAVISADGPTELCGGGAANLNAEPVAGTYEWLMNGEVVDGADGASYAASSSGNYSLVVTNACGTDTSEAITVSITDAPAYTFDQPAYLSCDGSPITIAAVDGSGQSDLAYEWFLNNASISGESGSTLLVAEAGSYTLTVTNTVTGCAYTADAVEVSIDQVGAPVINADGPLDFCVGDPVTLSVEQLPGISYQWSLDGVEIDGATDPSIVADQAGDYTIVAASTGCTSASSEAVTVVVEELPASPVITALDGTSFCEGNTATLDAGNTPGLSYQWSQDGAELDGETSGQLSVVAAGDYSVTVTTDAGCTATSDTVTMTSNPLPAQPVITPAGDQLTTSGDGTFQWLLNGNVIDGATGDAYLPTENGSYNVTITDANGCSSTSDAYAYISTSIMSFSLGGPSFYPNPTSGPVFIRWSQGFGANASVTVVDGAGKVILRRNVSGQNVSIDLTGYDAGIYSLILVDNGRVMAHRLILD